MTVRVTGEAIQRGDQIETSDGRWLRVRDITPGFRRGCLLLSFAGSDFSEIGKRDTVEVKRTVPKEEGG